jgi:hypothetical protein
LLEHKAGHSPNAITTNNDRNHRNAVNGEDEEVITMQIWWKQRCFRKGDAVREWYEECEECGQSGKVENVKKV